MVTRQSSVRASYDSKTRTWSGQNKLNLYDGKSVGEAIAEFLANHPDHLMQISENGDEMYVGERMKAMIVRSMAVLKTNGVTNGDNVIILMGKQQRLAAVLIACIWLGAKFCLLSPNVNCKLHIDGNFSTNRYNYEVNLLFLLYLL